MLAITSLHGKAFAQSDIAAIPMIATKDSNNCSSLFDEPNALFHDKLINIWVSGSISPSQCHSYHYSKQLHQKPNTIVYFLISVPLFFSNRLPPPPPGVHYFTGFQKSKKSQLFTKIFGGGESVAFSHPKYLGVLHICYFFLFYRFFFSFLKTDYKNK